MEEPKVTGSGCGPRSTELGEEPLVQELDLLIERLETLLSDLRKLQVKVSRMYVRGEIAYGCKPHQ